MVEEEERLIHDNIDNIIQPCISDFHFLSLNFPSNVKDLTVPFPSSKPFCFHNDSKSILFKMGEDECKSEDQVLFLS